MIAVVLWLLLVFVSITQSIEHQWLSKMTALSAPLRIKPSQAYLNSYFYLIDQYCEASNYKSKTFQEKLSAITSDPFNPELDENIAHLPMPHRASDGNLIDPVKSLQNILSFYRKKEGLRFHEFALSAGALHLNLKKQGQAQTLNQVLYLSSFNPESLNQGKLIESFDQNDLNHLLRNSSLEQPLGSIESFFNDVKIRSIRFEPFRIKVPYRIQTKPSKFKALALHNAEGTLQKVMLLSSIQNKKDYDPRFQNGLVDLVQNTFNNRDIPKDQIYIDKLENITLEAIKQGPNGRLCLLKGQFDNQTHFFELSPYDFLIEDFETKNSPLAKIQQLLQSSKNPPYPVLVPKSFKEQGAKLGDKGTISYGAKTLSGFQEMKAPIIVCGFYDPGIFSVGAKILIASREFIDLIGTSATTYALDPSETNGFLVFPKKFQ